MPAATPGEYVNFAPFTDMGECAVSLSELEVEEDIFCCDAFLVLVEVQGGFIEVGCDGSTAPPA